MQKLNKINCRICNEEYFSKTLWKHIEKSHNIKYEKYIEDFYDNFPNDFEKWRRCKVCNKLFKGKVTCSNECKKQLNNKSMRINCEICKKSISTITIKNHYRIQHNIILSSLECKQKYKKIENVIQCRECGLKLGVEGISNHLQKIHNIDYETQYVPKWYDKFPDEFKNWYRCRICNKLVKGHLTCSRKCDAEWKSETYKGRKGHNFTENEKRKISKIRKKQGSPWLNGKYHTEETKQKLSKIMTGKLLGKKNGMYGKTHTPEAVKKIFSHRSMNKLERIVADMLDRNNIKYHFQFFIIENKICKSYDFKIKRKPIIIEVDGDFWHGNPKLKKHWKDVKKVKKNDKLKEKIAKNRGYEVIRLWERDIKKSPELIEERLKNI